VLQQSSAADLQQAQAHEERSAQAHVERSAQAHVECSLQAHVDRGAQTLEERSAQAHVERSTQACRSVAGTCTAAHTTKRAHALALQELFAVVVRPGAQPWGEGKQPPLQLLVQRYAQPVETLLARGWPPGPAQ